VSQSGSGDPADPNKVRPARLERATSWFVAGRRESTGGSGRPLPQCFRWSVDRPNHPRQPRAAADCLPFVSRATLWFWDPTGLFLRSKEPRFRSQLSVVCQSFCRRRKARPPTLARRLCRRENCSAAPLAVRRKKPVQRRLNSVFRKLNPSDKVRIPRMPPARTDRLTRPNGTPAVRRFVLYADILGFGALTEQGDDDAEPAFDIIELVRPDTDKVKIAPNTRDGWFLGFHSAVTQITFRDRIRLAGHSLVAFSDSVFLVGDRLGVVSSATALMRLCLLKHIPVRMGIGYGTWIEVHFGSSFATARRHHAAQFFGSGVTTAHHAESKGGKGLRIFVHPAAAAQLQASAL
jgi:hypothetical protein